MKLLKYLERNQLPKKAAVALINPHFRDSSDTLLKKVLLLMHACQQCAGCRSRESEWKKLIHRFRVQGSCSNAQHFTCPAYHKNPFTEASIVYRTKKTLKATPTSPCFKSWSLSRLQVNSYTSVPTVPVFLIHRLAFSFDSL